MPKVNGIALRLEDLSLPADRTVSLRNLATGGAGTVILSVQSGASRTQAAEALARAVGRSFVRVNLGQVVSKFIGETEKKLDGVFASAAASGAVLVFDEADELFGKRADVKDGHDRHANVEVGYLLQKIEAYSGIVVLASSGRGNLDPALLKRLRHVVDLSWPPKGN